MTTMTTERPLILFTNDDGFQSPGLWAAVEAFADLGDVLVCAPREQQSGMSRSLPVFSTGRIQADMRVINGVETTVYAVDGTPAQAVQHGILELAQRPVNLVVSGINYGENCGNGVTISGTVGAALEASSFGIPAIAASQQTRHDLHLTYSNEVDFSAAAHFTRLFGEWLINNRRPDDVEVLKLDVPLNATVDTPVENHPPVAPPCLLADSPGARRAERNRQAGLSFRRRPGQSGAELRYSRTPPRRVGFGHAAQPRPDLAHGSLSFGAAARRRGQDRRAGQTRAHSGNAGRISHQRAQLNLAQGMSDR